MEEKQTERRSISLSKEDGGDAPRVREAYPVYSQNTDREALERQEYRNSPAQSPYQQSARQSPYYEDPMPAVNRYGAAPQQQPQMQNQNQNDDLGRYYNYEPVRDMPPVQEMPQAAPQVTQPPVQQMYPNNMGQPGMMQQQQTKFCKYCGEKIAVDAVICPHCGRQVEALNGAANRMNTPPVQQNIYNQNFFDAVSDKSKSMGVLLAALGFFGIAGIHRFYAGKPLSGILYLLTGGICGIGTLIDIISIASGSFRDGEGKVIKK